MIEPDIDENINLLIDMQTQRCFPGFTRDWFSVDSRADILVFRNAESTQFVIRYPDRETNGLTVKWEASQSQVVSRVSDFHRVFQGPRHREAAMGYAARLYRLDEKLARRKGFRDLPPVVRVVIGGDEYLAFLAFRASYFKFARRSGRHLVPTAHSVFRVIRRDNRLELARSSNYSLGTVEDAGLLGIRELRKVFG